MVRCPGAAAPLWLGVWREAGCTMAAPVLLIDDDDALRASLQEFLEQEGFLVVTARDGQRALDLLRSGELPALILLDFMMPVMNGSQFLAVKQREPRLRNIPVVMLSAWTREWPGQAMGVEHVLSKPIDPQRLLVLINRYCERKALESQR